MTAEERAAKIIPPGSGEYRGDADELRQEITAVIREAIDAERERFKKIIANAKGDLWTKPETIGHQTGFAVGVLCAVESQVKG